MLIDHIRSFVIRPALQKTELWSLAAEILLTGTILIETNCNALKQTKGPALGLFQIEPATHEDIKLYLAHPTNKDTLEKVLSHCEMANLPSDDELISNIKYGCLIARLIYHRNKMPLPAYDDFQGLANMYKVVYNTNMGKANYERCIGIFKGIDHEL